MSTTTQRFVSWNVPNLHLVEDPYVARVTEFEQTDAIEAVRQSGGGVARIYTLSVRKPTDDPTLPRHISNGTLADEGLMQDLDRAISLASKAGVKVIIPFIDHWNWWGSTGDFARQILGGGVADESFYTDSTVIAAFKRVISAVMLRNNTITGIPYRADSTILAWETGNELSYGKDHPPAAWTLDIAKHIRALSPLSSQLVIDGTHSIHGWPAEVFQGGEIDGFTGHYYPPSITSVPVGNWVGVGICAAVALTSIFLLGFHRKLTAKMKQEGRRLYLFCMSLLLAASLAGLGLLAWHITTLALTPLSTQFQNDMVTIKSLNSTKSFYIGEFGLRPPSEIEDVFKAVLAEPRCLGALVWSLRFRSSKGGFFVHWEQNGYASYHHPGLAPNPSAGFPNDDIAVNDLVRLYAAKIRDGQQAVALPVPAVPSTLNATTNAGKVELRWRGSTGARQYTIQRGVSGTWTTIATGVVENVAWGAPLYTDSNPVQDGQYRIRAENESGESGWIVIASAS